MKSIVHKDIKLAGPQQLDATVTLPINGFVPGKTAGLILTHGASGNHKNDALERIATEFALNDMICLRFTCNASSVQIRAKAFQQALDAFSSNGPYPVSKCILSGRYIQPCCI